MPHGDPTSATVHCSGDHGHPEREDDFEALVQRCEDRLRDLPLPSPFDVEALSRVIGARRERPIVLLPVPRMARVAGFCFPAGERDVIVYVSDTSPLHRQHIILHELCHLWCGHRMAAVTRDEVADALGRDVTMAAVGWVLRRASYDAAEDREAEVLATLIRERVAMAERAEQPDAARNERDALRRLAGILGDVDGPRG